jgi:hypothetical protein
MARSTPAFKEGGGPLVTMVIESEMGAKGIFTSQTEERATSTGIRSPHPET